MDKNKDKAKVNLKFNNSIYILKSIVYARFLIILLSFLYFILPVKAEFIRGMFTGGADSFDTLAAMGFNLVVVDLETDEIKTARRTGLKLIFTCSNEEDADYSYIKSLDTEPLITAWFPFDEPDIYGFSKDVVRERITRLRRFTNKPVMLSVWSAIQFKNYFPIADICSVTPYPIGQDPVNIKMEMPGLYTRYARNLIGRKPLYVFIQAFFQRPWWVRAPTPEEMHNIVYQVLTGEPDGIIYFIWTIGGMDNSLWELTARPDLMEEMKKINNELIEMDKILTKGKRSSGIKSFSRANVFFRMIKWRNQNYLIIANPNKDEESFFIEMKNNLRSSEIKFGSEIELLPHQSRKILNIKLGRYGYGLIKL